ncbi:hypothetical protein MNBD_UNCLBAC01-298 [hydrothermal vent metagenome]|uniref:Uncharacterized protein n=1 Tax=hydrothermal vent metagenome TaxID=652676 RepID=A0A3B1E3W2_9ZZZZ
MIMDIQTRKLNFIQEVLTVSNENLISKLESLLKKERLKDETIGFTTEGKPMTKEAYIHDIDEARIQMKEGKYVSQEELEKQSENW